MEETGLIRFPANLDPQAPEFRPSRNIINYHTLLLQPQIYIYPFIPTTTHHQHHLIMPAYYYSPSGVAPPLPPPAAAATSSLLLSSVPREATEETIRRDLQVFGEVREIEMERLLQDGIVIVHFYDLRHAQTAMIKIQEQYIHQQRRSRQYYFNFNHPIFMGNRWVLMRENLGSPPIPPTSCGGLISGQAVWAQYTFPARRTVSDFPPPNPTSVSVGQLLRNPNQSSEYQQNLNQPEVGRRLNTWRNHRRSNHHTNSRNTHFISTSSENNSNCFLINEETVSPRTTVMIKNIPNKYSQKLLINMLDNHCILCNKQITDSDDNDHQPLSSYDFVYLPIDFKNKCNMGYGFVNFTSPQAALRFYKDFHLQSWEVFGSRKICQVTYARLQGLVALKEYFKKSWFGCETDEYLPVMFSPARDGNQVTNPITIGNVHSGWGGGGLCDGKERHQ